MRKWLTLLPLFLLSTVPQAQQAKGRIGMVNVDAALKALPNSKTYMDLQARAKADLQAKQNNIRTLSLKAAATRAAADQQAVTKAQQALSVAQTDYTKRVSDAFKPLATRLNAAVAQVAKANGYSVILDQKVASQSGLVIYANEGATNITNAVIKALK